MGRRETDFSSDVKKKCWDNAAKFLGRDPSIWRLDAAGQPVMKQLHGMSLWGLCAWQYDHIIPPVKIVLPDKTVKWVGDSSEKNCQILQSLTNNRKHNRVVTDLQPYTNNIKLNEAQCDLVEMAVHGMLKDENGKVKCTCLSVEQIAVQLAGKKSLKPLAACEIPEPLCPKCPEQDCVSWVGRYLKGRPEERAACEEWVRRHIKGIRQIPR